MDFLKSFWGVAMLMIQTGRGRRLRKYFILTAFLLLVTGSLGALLTLHWYAPPPKK
jgi:hypothetical protein